jgi:hypothetical protein
MLLGSTWHGIYVSPVQLKAMVLVDLNPCTERSKEHLCMLMALALVLRNNALLCPVCTPNPAWTSHENLLDGAKSHLRP